MGWRSLVVLTLTGALLVACADDDPTTSATSPTGTPQPTNAPPQPTAAPPTTAAPPVTAAPASTAPPVSTEPATPTTTEPEIELPLGVLVAVPTQNREDPAKNQFQIQIHNGTRDRFDLAAVRFVWDGYTTPLTDRDSIVVGGQVIDFPVPFPGATCVGDGTRATMPSLDDAHVVLVLDSGESVEVPVVDQWHLARKLYEEDCEKQMIEAQVAIEWVGLHEAEFEGRPVTEGELQLTRKAGSGEITVRSVSDTIPFVFRAVETAIGEPVVTLAADDEQVAVPVRFIESRCDPHALAEIKQPTKFIAQVQLGDGSLHPYIIYPDRDYWTPMRLTADKACVALGKVEFLGD